MKLKAKKWMFMCLGIGVLSIAAGSGVALQKPHWNIGGTALAASAEEIVIDFSSESVGAAPVSFAAVVGQWLIGADGDNKVLIVDGKKREKGQTAAGVGEQARALYGEHYAEFLANVKAYAYYPFVIAKGVNDFRQGEISFRFKGIDGRSDQAAGILFNFKPNGDYLALRANCLENNLVLWTVNQGKRTSVDWVRNVPAATRQWHELKLIVKDKTVEGYLDGKLYLTHTLDQPVSGKVGIWSKDDSEVYFDDFTVKPANK